LGRIDLLRRHVSKVDLGLEIGASHSPTASKREGYLVKVLDHLDQRGLIEKYRDDPSVDTSRIEAVDYVWNGEPFGELIGPEERFAWIIASHVVEHVPDLVGFLNACESIMASDGVLTLAIPDKRFCFDRFRASSSLGMVVDAHLRGLTKPTPGTVLDFSLNYARLGGRDAWNAGSTGKFQFPFGLQESIERMSESKRGAYIDVHHWCFTPTAFRLLIDDLHRIGMIQLREVEFAATDGFEFFIWLSRTGKGSGLDRTALLNRIDLEIMDGYSWNPIKWRVKRLLRKLFS
jgi:hypothetical protein